MMRDYVTWYLVITVYHRPSPVKLSALEMRNEIYNSKHLPYGMSLFTIANGNTFLYRARCYPTPLVRPAVFVLVLKVKEHNLEWNQVVCLSRKPFSWFQFQDFQIQLSSKVAWNGWLTGKFVGFCGPASWRPRNDDRISQALSPNIVWAFLLRVVTGNVRKTGHVVGLIKNLFNLH